MWKRIASIILRNRIALMIIIGVLTIFMGYQASQVQMSYTAQSVLPATDSTLIAYKKFSKEFEKEGNIIFYVVEDKDFWQLNHIRAWKDLGNRLKKIKGVDAVVSVAHNTAALHKNTKERKFEYEAIFPLEITTQKQVDSLRNKLLNIPFYKGKLYDEASNSYMMLITANKGIMDSKARVSFMKSLKKELQDFSKQNDLESRITGLPYIRVEMAQMIKGEMYLFLILSALVTAIILFLFFRSFRTLFFSLLIVGTATVWAVGLMAILGFEITLLTAMLPPLLIVIGIPNCIFMINKYHSEYTKHSNKIMALQRVIMQVGNAIFLTNLTTAAGFATFIITSSVILVEFGIVASINILLLFLFSIILIPCIFSLQPPPKERHTKHLEYKYINKFINKLIVLVETRRSWIYGFTISLLILSAVGISQMKNVGYVVDDLPQDKQIKKDLNFFEEKYGGILPYEVVVDTKKPKGVMRLKTLKDIDNFSQEILKLDQFSSPLSIAEVSKFLNQAFYNGVESKYQVPTNKTAFRYLLTYAKNSGNANQVNNFFTSYVDSIGQKTRVTFYMKDIGTSEMNKLQKKVDNIVAEKLPEKHYKVTTTGSGVVFYKGTAYLARNLLLSLALAIFLIASFMAFMFSSKRMVVIALIPNLIPLLVTAALMGYFGIPLKASTILIFSIAFGISVDDTIHYLAKYRLDLSITKWDIKKAIKMALRETGQSMLYSSIILFFGFLIFSFSEFGGTKALGLLVSITLLTAMFSNLILLPSLLFSLEKSISNKDFKPATVPIFEREEDE